MEIQVTLYPKVSLNFLSNRGFGVAVPGFNRSYVNSEIYQKRYQQLNGFAKLLFLEHRDHLTDVLHFGFGTPTPVTINNIKKVTKIGAKKKGFP